METITKLVAFHGEPAIKEKYLARVKAHREADNLVRGIAWNGHRGCAIGCTLEKYSHEAYETELGIPRSIARLEDGLFESLPVELAMAWPERVLSAIRIGADLSLVMANWFVWMLVDPADGVLRFAKTMKQRDAIEAVGALYKRRANGEDVPAHEFKSAAAAAAYAYYAYAADAAAYAADAYAADAAAAAADAYAAAAAAADAYADAADAADAYAYAADAAAYADAADAYAYAADAAADADAAAARSHARVRQADKLIELLEAA